MRSIRTPYLSIWATLALLTGLSCSFESDNGAVATYSSQFTNHPKTELHPDWSADGKWIAFTSHRSGNPDIWMKSVDGGKALQVTTDPAIDIVPRWSPDGTRLLFRSDRGGSWNLWTVSPFEGEATATQITADADSVFGEGIVGSWSPDGSQIVFSADKGDHWHLWVIPASGGEAEQITTGPTDNWDPDWSPDGKWIAFSSTTKALGKRRASIWLVPSEGGPAKQMTDNVVGDYNPSWSPDGKWIAFTEVGWTASEVYDLWLIPSSGGTLFKLTDTPGQGAYGPRWSPDGTRITYRKSLPEGDDIWIMDVSWTDMLTGMGTIRGVVEWEDIEEGSRMGRVDIRPLNKEGPSFRLRTDENGEYALDLPPGSYRISAGYRGFFVDMDTVRVKTGETTILESVFVDQPPAVGTVRPSGEGTKTSLGRGYQRGMWTIFDESTGLGPGNIHAMVEDGAGRLWFATDYHGIASYDGLWLHVLRAQDGLPSDRVQALAVDDDFLWIGTNAGLSRYDGTFFVNYSTEDGLPSDDIHCLMIDKAGHLWLGTKEGVSDYDGRRFRTTRTGSSIGEVRTIAEAANGDVWAGGTLGAGILADSVVTVIEEPADVIFGDATGRVWLGRREEGEPLRMRDGARRVEYAEESGLALGYGLTAITQDSDGHLWFGTQNAGVTQYDGRRFTRHTSDQGLASDGVLSIVEDREGHLWFGTWGNSGISRYDGKLVETFTTKNGLPENRVYSIFQDRDGVMWFGTHGGGVARFDGKQWRTLSEEDGLVSSSILAIGQCSDGDLWFGGFGGVSRFDGVHFVDAELEVTKAVSTILCDRQDRLWLGHDGWDDAGWGVVRWEAMGTKTFTTDTGLIDDRVTAIVQDGEGNVWLGTAAGLNRWDGRILANFTDSLPHPFINGLAVADDGLWIATDAGLIRHDQRGFTPMAEAGWGTRGIVNKVLVDTRGHVWSGSWGGGVNRWDGAVRQTLNRDDGLTGNAVVALSRGRDGDVWIGTATGVTRYRSVLVPPRVEITRVLADQEYEWPDTLNLSRPVDNLLISFQGGNFKTPPDRAIYLHRMVGSGDDGWKQSQGRETRYPHLPAGNYRFEVKAVDLDLVYSEPAVLHIVISRDYQRFGLLFATGAALLGLVAAGGYGLQRRRERDRAREALILEQQEELQTARDMQMSLMPKESPTIEGLQVAARCVPAAQVGGDFFQYFHHADRLSISNADVTGHAMAAAIPVVMFEGVLSSQMRIGPDLESLFTALNDVMAERLTGHTFVCFSMAQIDTKSRSVRFANAGCPYPLHYHASGGEITDLQVDAYPLGVRAGTTYTAIESQLEPGDRLVFCSDGIIEAMNPEDELFGFERTTETILQGCKANLTADALLEWVLSEMRSFSGERDQEDDQTIVVVGVES